MPYSTQVQTLPKLLIIMRRNPLQAPLTSRSLQRYSCPSVDKTFPDLAERLRRNSIGQTNQAAMMATLRQYEKKFYHDEIKLLLARADKMHQKSKSQEKEIKRLKNQLSREQMERNGRENLDQLEATERLQGLHERPNHYLTTRLKNHYRTEIDKVKSDYEKKLREKDREKNNACKALQFQHHCQVMEYRFKQQQLKKEKQRLQNEKNTLKNKIGEFKGKQQKIQQIIELQSYKEENALLRSFIYKVQLAEQKLQQLQQSRKKERQQFVVFAEESQTEKRQLLKDLQNMKNTYEERISLLLLDFNKRLNQKDQQLGKLQEKIGELKLQNEMRTSIVKEQYEKSLRESMINCEEQNRKKEIEMNYSAKSSQLEWEKMEASLHIINSSKTEKIQKMKIEIEEYQGKQLIFTREIEKLRIQKNNLLSEVNKLQSERAQQIILASRLSQFDIPEVQSHVQEEENLNTPNIIAQLEKALTREEEKNKHMKQECAVLRSHYKTKENSMKLTLEMSENSYQELWQKHCIILTNLKSQRESKEKMTNTLQELTMKIKQSQKQSLENDKKIELLQSECQTWKNKYNTMKDQCDEFLKQQNEKCEQDEINMFRQKKDLERYERDMQLMRIQARRDYEEIQRQRNLKNDEIQGLRVELMECQAICHRQVHERDFIIKQLGQKQEMSQKCIEQLESTLAGARSQFKSILQQKQEIIARLVKQAQSAPVFKPITTLFPDPEANAETAAHYQQQICQINANHQNEIDHLKRYIHDLIIENDELRERYNEAAQSWKQMYEGVLKYNQCVDQGQMKLESSTSRKKEIVQELQNSKSEKNIGQAIEHQISIEVNEAQKEIRMIKSQETQVWQQMSNNSEVFTVPDFSEKKYEQSFQIQRQKNENQSISKNLAKQYPIIREEQQENSLSNSNRPTNI